MVTKVRAQHITIELPTEEAEVWVRATLQKCIKDESYNTIQTVDRVGYTHRSSSEFVMQMVTITDPVTQQSHTLSGAGIATIIRQLICQWMVEDRGGTINEHGDVIEG